MVSNRCCYGPPPCRAASFLTDAHHGKRLGLALTERRLAVARRMGVSRVFGSTTAMNTRMLATFKDHGFTVAPDPEDLQLMQVERLL